MICAALHHVADTVRNLSPYQPGLPITEVARKRGIRNIVKLASNENPLGCGKPALAALANANRDMLRLYPDANATALRRALAKTLEVKPETLILGNGSNDILELAAQLFLHENTAAIYSQHAFIVYALATYARRATPRILPAAQGYAHDLPALAAATHKIGARIMFIANPNNPTGTCHPPDAIRACLEKARSDVLVVLDEAYCEYLPDDAARASLKLLRNHANLLITRTFSKIHGLAGLRIGYGIGHPDLVQMMNRVRQPFNVNAVAQAAALAALRDTDHVQKSKQNNADGYRAITSACTACGVEFIPSHANFVTFRPHAMPAAAFYEHLLERGLITRTLVEYDLPDWLRITIGRPADCQRFIDTLQETHAPAAKNR